MLVYKLTVRDHRYDGGPISDKEAYVRTSDVGLWLETVMTSEISTIEILQLQVITIWSTKED